LIKFVLASSTTEDYSSVIQRLTSIIKVIGVCCGSAAIWADGDW